MDATKKLRVSLYRCDMAEDSGLLCQFCGSGSEIEEVAGKLHAAEADSKKIVSAHHRCMQYASALVQYRMDEFAIFGGFNIDQVEKEISRGNKLRCSVCKVARPKHKGASCGCAVKACRKTYHYPCAVNDPDTITKRLVVTTNKNSDSKEKFVYYRVFCSPEHELIFREELKEELRDCQTKQTKRGRPRKKHLEAEAVCPGRVSRPTRQQQQQQSAASLKAATSPLQVLAETARSTPRSTRSKAVEVKSDSVVRANVTEVLDVSVARQTEAVVVSVSESDVSRRGRKRKADDRSSAAAAASEVKSSRATENIVSSSRGTENIVSSSRATENIVSSSRGTENIVSSSRATENIVSSSRGTENIVSASRGTENIVSASRGTENIVSASLEQLKVRQHDPGESVRMEVVNLMLQVARKDFDACTDEMMVFIMERTLDKKFKIRREAALGLGTIYKMVMSRDPVDPHQAARVDGICNHLFTHYYHNTNDDRLLMERILNIHLVPYTLAVGDRMKKLLELYCTLNEKAVKAFSEMLKHRYNVRQILQQLLEAHDKQDQPNPPAIPHRLVSLASTLPEPNEYIKKLNLSLKDDRPMRQLFKTLVGTDCTCKQAEDIRKEVLRKVGTPGGTGTQMYKSLVKSLLERVAPVMIDCAAVKELVSLISDLFTGDPPLCKMVENDSKNGIRLLVTLSYAYPHCFKMKEVFEQLLAFLEHDDDIVCDCTLQILAHTGAGLEQHPDIYTRLIPVLTHLAKTRKQTKHALHCINVICRDNQLVLSQVFEVSAESGAGKRGKDEAGERSKTTGTKKQQAAGSRKEEESESGDSQSTSRGAGGRQNMKGAARCTSTAARNIRLAALIRVMKQVPTARPTEESEETLINAGESTRIIPPPSSQLPLNVCQLCCAAFELFNSFKLHMAFCHGVKLQAVKPDRETDKGEQRDRQR